MFSLAHISDVHLAPLPRVRPADLRGKRFIGYHSWHYRRRDIHRPEILEAVVADLLAHRPDHIALTGDLINLSLATEYRLAAQWLSALGDADQITVVPGNHDAYVPFPWDTGLGLWADYMTGDMRVAGAHGSAGLAAPFPFVRRRGNVALIGASSAVPMGWRLAAGRLGMTQIGALREILRELRQRGFFRILLIHHPPLPGQAEERKALVDASDLKVVLDQEGAELVLHGHNHQAMLTRLESAHGPVHVIGVPSASSAARGGKPPAAWNLYRIERREETWSCNVTVRTYDRATQQLRTTDEFPLDGIPAPVECL
ncbi:MAG TPA: metallophosphoesterase [Aestuariivirgaceae bacterium]|nr:metallophosphoesterase [Aestuariivirgaceae bacterium]